ncbi:uncharacterized protein [Clytia hemisphaerica]|uniref:Tox-ART-HYD1 domain-containing protein n=1 Tax=Clytia hemisphaerica TaxID=252671 RepID=A0A7M5TQ54_9CNID
MASASGKITLYHYTNKKAIDSIKTDKKLNKSLEKKNKDGKKIGSDTQHGEGVYFTTLTPGTAKEEIAKNNYDGNARNLPNVVKKAIKNGRVDYYIKITFDKNDTKLKECEDTKKYLIAMGRSVWLYEDVIDLTSDKFKYDYEFGETGASQALA